MKENNLGIARELIDCMTPSKAAMFSQLASVFADNQVIQRATINELINLVRTGITHDKIKSAEIIGVFHVQEAEPVLAEVLASNFPRDVLLELSRHSKKTSEKYKLLVSVLISLILLDSTKWRQSAQEIASIFSGSWVESSIVTVIAMK